MDDEWKGGTMGGEWQQEYWGRGRGGAQERL
jgi:hypothetical protein